MKKKLLSSKKVERNTIEYSWNADEINLFTIYNILNNLNFYHISVDEISKDIQSLMEKIEFFLGFNEFYGDIVKMQYIVTCEN